MDKIGPMCRSVEDCALVFNAIYGPDGRDDTVVDAPFAWNPDVPLSKLRIGYIKTEFEAAAGGRGRGEAGGRRGGAGGDAARPGRGGGRGRALRRKSSSGSARRRLKISTTCWTCIARRARRWSRSRSAGTRASRARSGSC